MSDTTTLGGGTADTSARRDGDLRTHLGWAVAGLSAAAGAIHLAMVPAHATDGLVEPVGFAIVGWLQILTAGAILADRAGRSLYRLAVVGNLAVLGLWIWSRITGLPFGSNSGVAEDLTIIDGAAAALEVGVILLAARILLAAGADPARRVAVGRLGPVVVGVAAIGLASAVIVSPDANTHGGAGHESGSEEVARDHQHGGASGDSHASTMAQIDADRCDRSFNIDAYWAETEYLGVDTYEGGAMAAEEHGNDAASTPTTVEPDPTGGRGSETLDGLVGLTSLSDGGELAAAQLVSGLGEADQDDYDAWLWWLKSSGVLGGHGDHAEGAPGDTVGHGGHAGPQAWTALTDRGECDRLADELDLARETALKYPTAADATEAGWVRVAPYVPGIAAHYMKFSLVDSTFEIDQPEMILYDGNDPDAHVVGLSYYLIHEGDLEPTQGFTGANDHGHRHIGLCTGPGGVIGDSATTPEECEARGGKKADGSKGWMSHAWVVPGCASPWGVFSAASPILDNALSAGSGENDGGCSASGVRDRYDLPDAERAAPAEAAPARGGG